MFASGYRFRFLKCKNNGCVSGAPVIFIFVFLFLLPGELLVGFHASVTVIRLTDIHACGGLFCKTHTVGVVIFIPYGSSVFHFGICDGIGTFPGKLPCVELHFAPCFREKEIHVMRSGNRCGTVDGYFCGLRCGEVEGDHGFGFYVV